MNKIILFVFLMMLWVGVTSAQQDDLQNNLLKSGVWLQIGYVSPL
jgi:hypothetical protein